MGHDDATVTELEMATEQQCEHLQRGRGDGLSKSFSPDIVGSLQLKGRYGCYGGVGWQTVLACW